MKVSGLRGLAKKRGLLLELMLFSVLLTLWRVLGCDYCILSPMPVPDFMATLWIELKLTAVPLPGLLLVLTFL